MGRVLRRLDQTARTFFAVVDPGSCYAGSLLELALAADRSYVLDHPEQKVQLAPTVMNGGALPMHDGRSRLQVRFLAEPERPAEILSRESGAPLGAQEADELGLCTVLLDDLDFDDTLRLAIEE